jgi:ATP synthase protein I
MIRTFQTSEISQESAANKAAAPYAAPARGMYQSLSMSAVGLEMGLCVIIGLFAGKWVDERLGTGATVPWFLMLGLGLGFAAGIKGVMRAVRNADKIAVANELVAAQELQRAEVALATQKSLATQFDDARDTRTGELRHGA